MHELTEQNFDSEIKKGFVLVDFWAPWCGPCRMLSPVVDQLSAEMKGVKFGKLNVDEQPSISEKFEVSSIPTLLLFKDGQVIGSRVGATSKETLRQWIDSSMKGE